MCIWRGGEEPREGGAEGGVGGNALADPERGSEGTHAVAPVPKLLLALGPIGARGLSGLGLVRLALVGVRVR